MTTTPAATFSAFAGSHRIASGALADIALPVRAAIDAGEAGVLVFDDRDGQQVDLDLRGGRDGVRARYAASAPDAAAQAAPRRGPGRPKLGVIAREVTLLPRHWDWLAAQPGGASVSLRRLVEQARRANAAPERKRAAREAAYRVMSAIAGDASGFEEATRALFAEDKKSFFGRIADWPVDVRDYVAHLASASFD